MTQNNLELVRTLNDSWNAQDWDTFEKRHSKDTAVFWPGQAEPTRGRDNHKAESVEFFKTFPDNHLINHPYSGDCSGRMDVHGCEFYRYDARIDEGSRRQTDRAD
jgi:SnoaL-like polyketide cyclase